jgi:hypothetical protein
MMTATGSYYDFLLPGEHDFDLHEIAHALSHICRFTGHTYKFYSVAQHSVLVSQNVPQEHALAALLHDASEAYLGDVSSPLKSLLPDYKALEKDLEKRIFDKFDLPFPMHSCIKDADLRMLMTERRDLLPKNAIITPDGEDYWETCWAAIEPYPALIECWSPEVAKLAFLSRFDDLTSY